MWHLNAIGSSDTSNNITSQVPPQNTATITITSRVVFVDISLHNLQQNGFSHCFQYCIFGSSNQVISSSSLSTYTCDIAMNLRNAMCNIYKHTHTSNSFNISVPYVWWTNREVPRNCFTGKVVRFSVQARVGRKSRTNASKGVSSVCEPLPPDRPVWFPGTSPPEWLDGR